MNRTVRKALANDVDRMMAIKEELSVQASDSVTDGFLLGTDEAVYQHLIEARRVWVIEENEVLGFAVTLSDSFLRRSDFWQRRHQVEWSNVDWNQFEQSKVGYFDQLAMASNVQRRHWGAALALRAVDSLFKEGHDHVFATTVIAPFKNEAALPLLHRIGSRPVGTLKETYPCVGELESRLHHVDKARYLGHIEALKNNTGCWEADLIRHARL